MNEEDLKMELDAARMDTDMLRNAVAKSIGYFMSKDGTKITVHIDNQLFSPSVTEYIRYDCVQDNLQKLMRMLLEKEERIKLLEDECQGLEHQLYEAEREIRRLKGRIEFLENQ